MNLSLSVAYNRSPNKAIKEILSLVLAAILNGGWECRINYWKKTTQFWFYLVQWVLGRTFNMIYFIKICLLFIIAINELKEKFTRVQNTIWHRYTTDYFSKKKIKSKKNFWTHKLQIRHLLLTPTNYKTVIYFWTHILQYYSFRT